METTTAALQAGPGSMPAPAAAAIPAPKAPPAAAAAPRAPDNPAPWQDYQTVFTNAKAGMDGVDKAHVQKVVYEMSKDSAHFRNEQRKQAQLDSRIHQLRARSEAIGPAELAAATRSVDARIAALESRRDLTRTWLHADMDCFYAAVHERERPELKHLPVAIGGLSMISTANYAARKFGVRSAMPGFIAKRLCPQLVFIPVDFRKYTAAAEEVRAVLRQLDPDFESGGLDEAYLDITDYCHRTGCSGAEAAEQLRRRVRESCGGLTCSCGVAPNKMLAKICSDINKPDGQYVLPPSRTAILSFLDTLPARKIPCIGKVTEQLLRGVLGVSTCGQLLGPHRGRLPLLFSETAAGFFLEAALGLAATRHATKADPSLQQPGRKGISCERTFRNMTDPRQQEAMARQLVESLAADMAAEELEGRNLTLKLKLSTFEVRTRAATLPRHVRTASDMLPTVLRLLRSEEPLQLRLMGVRMAALRKVNSATRSPLARLLGLRSNRQPAGAAVPPQGAATAVAAEATGSEADAASCLASAAAGGRPPLPPAAPGRQGQQQHRQQQQQPASAPAIRAAPWSCGSTGAEAHAPAPLCASAAAEVAGGADTVAARGPPQAAARTREPGASPQGLPAWLSSRPPGFGCGEAGGFGCGGGGAGGAAAVVYDGAGAVRVPCRPSVLVSTAVRVRAAGQEDAGAGAGKDEEEEDAEAVTPRAAASAGAGVCWDGFGEVSHASPAAAAAEAGAQLGDGWHEGWSYNMYGELGGDGLYDELDGNLDDDDGEEGLDEDVLADLDPAGGWRCDGNDDPWAGPCGVDGAEVPTGPPAKRPRLDAGGAEPGPIGPALQYDVGLVVAAPPTAAVHCTAAAAERQDGGDGRDGRGQASNPPLPARELATGSICPGITGRRLANTRPPPSEARPPKVPAPSAAASGLPKHGITGRLGSADLDSLATYLVDAVAVQPEAEAAAEAAEAAADEAAAGGDPADADPVSDIKAQVISRGLGGPAARRGDSSSGGGGAAVGAGGGGSAAGGAGPGPPPAAASSCWTCRVCTYAHNRRPLLRCEVCDCLRGSTEPPPERQQQQHQHDHHHHHRTAAYQPHRQHPQQNPQQRQQRRGSSWGHAAAGACGGGGGGGALSAGGAAARQQSSGRGSTSSGATHGAAQPQPQPQPGQRHLERLWAAAVAPPPPPGSRAVAAGRRPQASPQQQEHRTQRPQQGSATSCGPARNAAAATAAAAAAAASSTRQCPQCGAAVAAGRWVEHQDWHLALLLSREGTTA